MCDYIGYVIVVVVNYTILAEDPLETTPLFVRCRARAFIHSTLPRLHWWDYNWYVVVVVVLYYIILAEGLLETTSLCLRTPYPPQTPLVWDYNGYFVVVYIILAEA